MSLSAVFDPLLPPRPSQHTHIHSPDCTNVLRSDLQQVHCGFDSTERQFVIVVVLWVTTAWGQNIRWKSFVFLFFGREVGEVHMCVCVWMCALVCFRATLPLQVEKNRYFSLGFFRNPDFRQSIFTLLNSNAAWKEFSSASETLHVFDALPSYQTVHSGKLVNCQMMHSGALLRCQKMYSGVLSCCQVIFSGVELSCWMMRSGNIISWQMMLSGLPLFCGGDVFRFPRAAWLHIQEQST